MVTCGIIQKRSNADIERVNEEYFTAINRSSTNIIAMMEIGKTRVEWVCAKE